jgi:hypothetical protein
MRARRILRAGAFGPEDVDRLQEAFDMVWKFVEHDIPVTEHSAAREVLATIIVSAGNVSGLDAGELASVAERTFRAIHAGT